MAYQPPTPTELRTLLRRWRLTQTAAAAILLLDPRTVGRWAAGDVPVPFAALACLAARYSGRIVDAETWRESLRI